MMPIKIMKNISLANMIIVLLLAYPFLYLGYLNIVASMQAMESITVLETNPILALNLIIVCTFPFIALLIKNFQKNIQTEAIPIVYIMNLVVIVVSLLIIKQYFIAALLGYLIIHLVKQNALNIEVIFETIKKNRFFYLKSCIPAIVILIILSLIKFLIVFRGL